MLLRSLPPMSRPHAVFELSVWALMAVPMGVLYGGVAGVLVNTVFAGSAPVWIVAIAVALLTGAGPLANMGSLGWAHWSLGREKVAAMNRLQWLFAVALIMAALAPINLFGLAVFVIAILIAQILWCGIITIRASVWRLNYDRAARFAFAADNQAIVSLRPSRNQEAEIRPLLEEISIRLRKLAELVADGRAECRAAEELLEPTLEFEEKILRILR